MHYSHWLVFILDWIEAGRTAPGRCYYLYSQSDLLEREPYDVPRINDSSVDELIMCSLNVWCESIENCGDAKQEIDSDHDLGDHMLALNTFEKFEEKKRSGLSDRQMRKWGKNYDLIYHVLDMIQNTVEQSCKEMKKFKYLQQDDSSATFPERMIENEDECLLRVLLSNSRV